MDTVLQQLIELVKATAPALWEIARRQVMVQVWQDAILSVVCIAFVLGYVQYFRWFMKKIKSDNEHLESWRSERDWTDYPGLGMMTIMGGILAVVAICLTVGAVVVDVGRLMNPDYYAIQVLLSLAK